MNVKELIDLLQEVVEKNPEAATREVLGAYQPSWPLQEAVSGIFDPLAGMEELHVRNSEVEECARCEESIPANDQINVLVTDEEREDQTWFHPKCAEEAARWAGDPSEPIYIVVTGESRKHPHPYAPKRAFQNGW